MSQDKPHAIRAILFDFGGVLAEEGFYHGLKAIAEQQGMAHPDKLMQQGMDVVYDSGYVIGKGSERDFWRLLRQRTGIQGRDDDLTQEILSRFVLRPWMLDLANQLKQQGYITGILSDQTDWLERLNQHDGFLEQFDCVFVSYHRGKGKRDPSLFDDVVRELGLRPEEVLFIDDAEGNVARAHARGLNTILFRDRQSLMEELAAFIQARD